MYITYLFAWINNHRQVLCLNITVNYQCGQTKKFNLKYFNYTYHNTAALTIIAISIFIQFTVKYFCYEPSGAALGAVASLNTCIQHSAIAEK